MHKHPSSVFNVLYLDVDAKDESCVYPVLVHVLVTVQVLTSLKYQGMDCAGA